MRARLVWIEGDQEVETIPLEDRPLVIGRDPRADVVIDHPRISREHARLEPTEWGWAIRDLGSRNGTRVNGQPVTDAEPLEADDRIELGEVELIFEVLRSTRAAVFAFAAILFVLAFGAGLLFGGRDVLERLWDPVMRQAAELAREGVRAYDEGDPRLAKEKLNAAVGLLFARGRLDDVPRLQVQEQGIRRLQKRLDENRDLLAIYLASLEGSKPHLPTAGARGPCRLDRAGAGTLDVCIQQRAERVLIQLWQEPGKIPESFYRAVNEQVRFLGGERREWLEASLDRGRPLFAMMNQEFQAARVPEVLRYLAMIESGYRTKIRSKAGARGMWQFMPATARQFGLRIDGSLDERTDPEKSTRAAARYLRDLAFEFGGDALLLAIAAYNKGENGIRYALKKLDDPRTDRSYWTLVERDLIPSETQEYVPRFVAAAVLGEAGIPRPEGLSGLR